MSAASDFDSAGLPSLIDLLLSEQQSLPAVDTFARRHAEGELSSVSDVYEERIGIEIAGLRAGQQLAFRVDLDACTGCKACVTACHSMNGLAEDETWRDVGLLVGVGAETGAAIEPEVGAAGEFVASGGFQQTVTTACHHCEDPACLAGCPVLAYEKDPVTGIVRHLDDQCIGCQYCILKCPYDVPKYSAELGIVRKCDMCTGRLAVGESPACVQGCPNGAISIEVVDAIANDSSAELLAGMDGLLPDSSYTRPTTRYVSDRRATTLKPAGVDRLSPGHAHDPLSFMLVMLQLSVGTLGFGMAASMLGLMTEPAMAFCYVMAAGTGILGLAAATLHLGRPMYAFRAFLGWRTSWMSREIIVVGLYVPAIVMTAVASLVLQFAERVEPGWVDVAKAGIAVLPVMSLLAGVVGIGCSMMIYVDTRRRAWSLARTSTLFIGTLLGLGAMGAGTALVLDAAIAGESVAAGSIPLFGLGLLVLGMKLRIEKRLLESGKNSATRSIALVRGAQLMRGPLRVRARARLFFAGVGMAGAAFSIALLAMGDGGSTGLLLTMAGGSLLLCTAGEIVERHLYFTAEASPGMPGH